MAPGRKNAVKIARATPAGRASLPSKTLSMAAHDDAALTSRLLPTRLALLRSRAMFTGPVRLWLSTARTPSSTLVDPSSARASLKTLSSGLLPSEDVAGVIADGSGRRRFVVPPQDFFRVLNGDLHSMAFCSSRMRCRAAFGRTGRLLPRILRIDRYLGYLQSLGGGLPLAAIPAARKS